MVTAIVIPIICLYFFWLTRKEMNEQDQKWLDISNVQEEAVITGQIYDLVEEKQRFYYNRYIYVQELTLQTEIKSIKLKKITPYTKDINLDPFTVGTTIRAYGKWEGNDFVFNHFEVINSENAKKVTH
jgi:hypothetical protein